MIRETEVSFRQKKRAVAILSETLTLEWDYQRNGQLTPLDVQVHEARKIHWVCQHCGGRFQSTVKQRYYRKAKCPHCLGKTNSRERLRLPVEKSLGYLYPYLMKEWHPFLNEHLNAFELLPQSGISVWWKCQSPSCRHQWRTPIFQRTCQAVDCPVCTK